MGCGASQGEIHSFHCGADEMVCCKLGGVRYSGVAGDWRGAEWALTNDIPVNLAGQHLENLGRGGGREHEGVGGGGGG